MPNVLDDIKIQEKDFLVSNLKKSRERIDLFVSDLLKDVKAYIKEGNRDVFQNANSVKENAEPSESVVGRKKVGRKGILSNANQDNIQLDALRIKKEKMSMLSTASEISSRSSGNSNYDTAQPETILNSKEDMPAPKKMPPRKRKIKDEPAEVPKRSTRTKKKPLRYEAETLLEKVSRESSDIIIQNTTVTTIDITEESDKERHLKKKNESSSKAKPNDEHQVTAAPSTVENTEKISGQPTSSVAKKTNTKRLRSLEEDGNIQVDKKSKSSTLSDTEANRSVQTEYEDAISTPDKDTNKKADATYVAQSKTALTNMNCTVVLEKPRFLKNDNIAAVAEQKKQQTTPEKPLKKTKEIFSPFEKTTTKNKVAAFEKLTTDTSKNERQIVKTPKPCTPLSKFVPKTCSTSKTTRLMTRQDSGNDSVLSSKSRSALKASQTEFREREKRRQEKEHEALKKKEAFLLAVTEEKKRRREEKQMKAQQQREMLEKETKKKVDVQKIKEQRHKQVLAEKEEKIQKQREEAEKKRLLVKKKAEELKLKEGDLNNRDEKDGSDKNKNYTPKFIKKPRNPQVLPEYMISKPPLLPTLDCYDSDDSEHEKIKMKMPSWGRGDQLRKTQIAMISAGEKIKNTFFCRQIHTPDLRDIFEYIDPVKLKRTSSAHWRKPPRYTLFQETSNVIFSEDECE